ncbi:Cytoskeleton associated protein 5, partial [Kappamyces sp. JEL0680]
GTKPKAPAVAKNESSPEAEPSTAPKTAAPEPPVIDAFDLADPVPFLEKLPKSFYTDLASTKWKERKEACELLLKLVSFPKLEDGRYYELVNVLAKKLADPNVVVAVLVANILEKMALGLKTGFALYRNIVVAPLMDRMKEKKTHVLEALRGALDATIASLSSFTEMMDDATGCMGHSNPTIRVESLQLVSRFLASPRAVKRFSKTDIKPMTEKLLKAIDDSVPEVRDAAALSIASMMTVFGEKTINPYLERLDKPKMVKVMDIASKLSSGEAVAAAATSKPKPAPMSRSSSSVAAAPQEPSNAAPAKPLGRSKPKLTPSASKSSLASSKQGSSKQGSSSSVNLVVEQPIKYEFSDDSAVEYAENLFGAATVKMLSDSAWKVRLEGMTAIKNAVETQSELKAEGVLRFLLKSVGWKESNFQVMNGMIAVMQL